MQIACGGKLLQLQRHVEISGENFHGSVLCAIPFSLAL